MPATGRASVTARSRGVVRPVGQSAPVGFRNPRRIGVRLSALPTALTGIDVAGLDLMDSGVDDTAIEAHVARTRSAALS
jgi:hypothetical protein